MQFPSKKYASIAAKALSVEKERKKAELTREMLVLEDGTLAMYVMIYLSSDPLMISSLHFWPPL